MDLEGRGRNLEAVLVEYAKQHISDQIRDLSLGKDENLELTTYNAPDECPFQPSLKDFYIPTSFDVELHTEMPDLEISEHSLASRIIELRDNVNAIFGEKYNGKLLSLTQERALLELSRSCLSQEEFAYRVISLCELAKSFDPSTLPKTENSGSIDRFGEFLRIEYPDEDISAIMERLTAFNHLRRLYPVHSDRAGGVVKSHEYFGIGYPVVDFNSAWELLRDAYTVLLEDLLDVLKG